MRTPLYYKLVTIGYAGDIRTQQWEVNVQDAAAIEAYYEATADRDIVAVVLLRELQAGKGTRYITHLESHRT